MNEQNIFCSHQCSPESSVNIFRVYIQWRAFRPSEDSSVWLGLTSKEQLMSPDCSKLRVVNFDKMLVLWWTKKKYSVLISVLQSTQWINSESTTTKTSFVLQRTDQCFSRYRVESSCCHQNAQSTRFWVLLKCFWCVDQTKIFLFSSVSSRVVNQSIQSIYPQTPVSSLPGLISVARVNKLRTTDFTRVLKAPGPELWHNACRVVNERKIFCSDQCSPECSMNKFPAYINRYVFRASQGSSVWLVLTSREQLTSPDCSKHQVLVFAKMLIVWWANKKNSVLISVLQSAQWINSERISTDTYFVLARTHPCGSG